MKQQIKIYVMLLKKHLEQNVSVDAPTRKQERPRVGDRGGGGRREKSAK